MMANLDFELASHEVEVGQLVSGSLICSEADKSFAIEVSVGWHTNGKGDRDSDVVSKQIFNDLKPNIIKPFELFIPTTAPPSYEGKLIRISWEVKFTIATNGFWTQNKAEEYFAALRVLPSTKSRSF